jgi:predicted flap endonuclease-1-like 5' DNA nuclease
MATLAEYHIVIIAIAAVIGLIVAFWAFRRVSGPAETRTPTLTERPATRTFSRDGPEGNAVTDEFAAATRDIAGEMLGVDAHPVVPGPSGPPDDLRQLKGVGPKLAAQLNEIGITRYDQLARLNPDEIARLDARMGAFRGRLERDRLVEQAAYLERGDTEGFEAQFGKLGGA